MECCAELRTLWVMALGGGAWADEVRFQLLRCAGCGRGFLAVVEDSRRGAMDSDGCDRSLRPVSEADWAAYESLLKLCPDREREDCACCAHRELKSQFVRS